MRWMGIRTGGIRGHTPRHTDAGPGCTRTEGYTSACTQPYQKSTWLPRVSLSHTRYLYGPGTVMIGLGRKHGATMVDPGVYTNRG